MSAPEFSVYWEDPDGYSHPERRFVDARTAVELAYDLTLRPAVRLGIIHRIIIVDGEDCCVFEWLLGKGVTYPKVNL